MELDVVVVAAGCTDETVPLVEREFPEARTISCANRGFAYANNQALRTVNADWVLLLNPDTEILESSFADLIDRLDSRPTVGLVGVRQLTADGQVFPTIRRFPNAMRSLFEALGSERFPIRTSWLGERELDLRVYERDVACDWTSGSFMLIRWEALQSAGFLDERFFLFCEETDLCLRIKQAGWEIRHVPYLTILHHADKAGWNPRLDAQAAFAKRQFFRKHLSPLHRAGGDRRARSRLHPSLHPRRRRGTKGELPRRAHHAARPRAASIWCAAERGIGRRFQALRPRPRPRKPQGSRARNSVHEDVGEAAT